ncbi:MAG: glucuronosyltransferase [Deltaproteobacteria bacterium]|nr:glucuronosyltransferase [Deltaproteobacteria bacterium]
MIFVTVGGQIPFDRLVRTVDEWAGARGRTDVFAQIGPTDFRPRHIEAIEFLSPEEFRRKVENARTLVAHAGMGSIITALEIGTPVLVMPRRADLHETRNDHQVSAATRFQSRGIMVAFDEKELWERLDALDSVQKPERISNAASPGLIRVLREFFEQA